jgi:hypothetical protein
MQHSSRLFLRSAAVVAAIFSLGAIAQAALKDCHLVANDVPFFGAFIGVPNVDVDLTTGMEAVKFRGVGVANGMDDVLCRSDDELVYPYPVPDPSKGTLTSGMPTVISGTYTITGDDGDSIVIWIYTPPEKYSFNPATGHLDFAGTFTVIPGGTGRYRDATGSGTLTGSADAHPVTGIPVNGHVALVGQGRWAIWGTLSRVREVPHCGR